MGQWGGVSSLEGEGEMLPSQAMTLLAPASHDFRPRLHFNPKLRLLPQEL